MEPISCQSCGAAVPVGVGIQGFTCPYCGATDSVASELRDRVSRFYDLVRAMSDAVKRISPQMEKAALHLGRHGQLTKVMLFVSGMAMLVSSGSVLMVATQSGSLQGIFGGLIPVVFGLAGFAAVFVHRWREKKIERLFVARPPLESGGPARCRLCGAPLPTEGAVRTCKYCGAESVLPRGEFAEYADNFAAEIVLVEQGLEKKLRREIAICENVHWIYLLGGGLMAAVLVMMIALASGGLSVKSCIGALMIPAILLGNLWLIKRFTAKK